MNGSEFLKYGKRQVRAMMRLRGKESDTSNRKPGMKAFSESVAPLIVGANSKARHKKQIAVVSNHQWPALRSNGGALTIRSLGRFAPNS